MIKFSYMLHISYANVICMPNFQFFFTIINEIPQNYKKLQAMLLLKNHKRFSLYKYLL